MDTSKQYILMCEGAQEIQSLRIDSALEGRYHGEDGDFFRWQPNARVPVFLPRQDQLQQMRVGDEMNRLPVTLINVLIAYRTRVKKEWEADQLHFVHRFKTMEQIWLSIIMEELYNKRWNDLENRWELIQSFKDEGVQN